MDIQGIQFLQVTNTKIKEFACSYHGQEYRFKMGEPVTLPVAAAAHIFGFGETNKLPAFHRLGWVTTTQQLESGMKKLKDIKFEPVKQVYELSVARDARGIDGDPATGAPDVRGAASES